VKDKYLGYCVADYCKRKTEVVAEVEVERGAADADETTSLASDYAYAYEL
jgi:hypothetical protein